MTLFNLMRLYNTVKYMTPRQWKYRFYYKARNSIWRIKINITPRSNDLNHLKSGYSNKKHFSESVVKANRLLNNEIPSLADTWHSVNSKFDWDLSKENYRLMSFRLNSFNWLLYLSDAYRTTGDARYIKKGFELIDIWWKKNSLDIKGDKWNPYVVAERLTNWIGYCVEYSKKELEKYASWIYSQAIVLSKSIEYQLGGNHLLSEAKSLTYAGSFLKDNALYLLGKRIIFDEAHEQFLSDGGHYERSVSYHVESLQQLFETYSILKQLNDPDADVLLDLMKKPYQFLNGMIGVDGRIPLFNDSAVDYPFYDAKDFLSTSAFIFSEGAPKGKEGYYAGHWNWLEGSSQIIWPLKTFYEQTGYLHYRFPSNNYSLFMDVANNGPDYNLGHAHADALSILLTSTEKGVFVDSGVFTYQPGDNRNYCRSTKAHNTVEIDGLNSAEIWSAFRVARRGYCKLNNYSETLDGISLTASHDGYKRCGVIKSDHKRTLEISNSQKKITIIDTIEPDGERHTAVSRFHLGPSCTVKLTNEHECLIDDSIILTSTEPIKLVDCSVADYFGKMVKTKCIEASYILSNYKQTTTTIIFCKEK